MKPFIRYFFIPSFVFAITLNGYSQPGVTDFSNEIKQNWENFKDAWNKFDAEACTSIFAIDAVYIPPQSEVRNGRENIAAFYSGLFESHSSARYMHETISVTRHGNLAVEQGQFSVDWTRMDGTLWNFEARSLAHWEKDDSGEWKIKTLIFNMP